MRAIWKRTVMSALVVFILLEGTATLSANAAPIKVYGISVSGPPNPFYVKSTFQLKPQIKASSETKNVKIGYKSGNNAIAAVSPAGVVTANGAGKTNIEVTAGGRSVQLLVNVKSKVREIGLAAAKSKITVGEQTKLTPRIVMDHASLPVPSVSYKVEDPTILYVDAAGNVTALKEGKTDISIRAEEKTAKTTIEVTDIEWKATTGNVRFERPSWSADGKYLALNDRILNAQDGRTMKQTDSDLMFVGNQLYSWNNEDRDRESMFVYDSAFRLQRQFEMPEEARKFYTDSRYAFSPDGRHFYFQYSHKGVFDLDMQNGEVIGQAAPDDIDTAWDTTLALSPNGQMLAVLGAYGYSGESRIYDLNSGRTIGSTTEYGPAAFTPDSRYLVIHNREGLVVLDTQNFTVVHELPGEFEGFALGSGGWLAVTNENGDVDVYEIETLKKVRSYATKETQKAQRMDKSTDQPVSLTFSPDGRKLVVGYSRYAYGSNETYDTICWNLNGLYIE
ncbi:hypothetical protein CDO73_09270 [Saccharibacillus sp. O23]|uniref:Ig-like domain-containing protein n=1 Tax=Saccharibacillus sp. O23 TaxID=2009338 RepID=UPI000B4E7FEF|nr:Ig-like domain-containing protein [Saccharibacillus sp. O23]OWR30771.1 hypothetical protein CDO73_09270 [Saccharibacillus sp. O23]